jgi:hypothetical protein
MYEIPSGEASPEILLNSLGNRIPGIVQACGESRALTLEALADEFQPTFSLHYGIAFYTTFQLDTIMIPGGCAQWISESAKPTFVAARKEIRHIICLDNAHIATPVGLEKAIARLVLVGGTGFWPCLETWSFPGWRGADGDGRQMSWVKIEVARPRNAETAKKQIRRTTQRIKYAMKVAFIGWINHGIGLRILYTCPDKTRQVQNTG